MASALTFSERYHETGEEFLNNTIRVTGDETWISFVDDEIKCFRNSGCTHVHHKSRNFLNKRCLPES
jgi:hypothetical protein